MSTIANINRKDQRLFHFVGIGLVLSFLLPQTSVVLMLVNPLLCLLYKCFRQNRIFYNRFFVVLIPILLTFMLNITQDFSMKAVMSFLSVLLFFSCFPFVGKVKIPVVYFYVILLVILLSQIAFAFDIVFFENILNTYYPLSEEDRGGLNMQASITSETLFDYRLGGLYHNSNQCARSLSFLLAAFIILNYNKTMKALLPFVVVNYSAILITGSRTGFVIGSLIIIAYMYNYGRISSFWKTIFVFSFFIVFFVIVFSDLDSLRGFNVVKGFDNSVNYKFNTFVYYITNENSLIRLLLGNFDVDKFVVAGSNSGVLSKFDSDYGNIIFTYGLIGLLAFLFFFYSVFLKINKTGRIFFILLLWMFTSAIITSYRALFIFMFLLSVIYSNNKRFRQPSQKIESLKSSQLQMNHV